MSGNKINFEQEVLKSDVPVVIDFWAPWCGYCRRLMPAVDRLANELDGKVRVIKLNVDEEPEISEKYKIDIIPTLILFQNGEASEQLVNPPSQAAITEWLGSHGAV